MDAEPKPVTIAEVIAGGQTIATHCLACGPRGDRPMADSLRIQQYQARAQELRARATEAQWARPSFWTSLACMTG